MKMAFDKGAEALEEPAIITEQARPRNRDLQTFVGSNANLEVAPDALTTQVPFVGYNRMDIEVRV